MRVEPLDPAAMAIADVRALTVARVVAVDLAVADDPMARQYAVQAASDAAKKASGRSSAGRAGQRGGNVKRRGR